MGISDVIKGQERLIEIWNSPQGQRVMQLYGRYTGDNPKVGWIKVLRELKLSDPVLVTPPICDLLEFSSRSWPDKFTLREEDVPLKRGFVMFDKPLWLPPQLLYEDEGVPTKADLLFMVWSIETITDETSEFIGRRCLTYSFYDEECLTDHKYIGLFHSSGWLFGDDTDWSHNITRKNPPTMYSVARMKLATTYLMSFLRFISSKVVDSDLESVKNKSARRNFERGPLKRVPDVFVTKLRRKESPKSHGEESTPTGRKYDHHRWPVEAHWHQYHFSKTGESRPLWVETFIKGPDDKPLIVPKKAYVVAR